MRIHAAEVVAHQVASSYRSYAKSGVRKSDDSGDRRGKVMSHQVRFHDKITTSKSYQRSKPSGLSATPAMLAPTRPLRMKLKLELAQPLPASAGAAISGRPPRKSGKMQCSHQHPNHHHLHRCHHHHSTLPAGTCQGEPLKRRDAVDLV